MRQFSLNLRADLAGTRVRVSNIEPGLCSGTDFSVVRLNGDLNAVDALYRDVQAILPEDIAAMVAWIAEQPPHRKHQYARNHAGGAEQRGLERGAQPAAVLTGINRTFAILD